MRHSNSGDRTNPKFVVSAEGITGALFNSINWNEHPLGPTESWPEALKTSLQILFHARHPMFIWWGPELFQFYNDAYVPSFGVGKHPVAMGQRGFDCWPEIWSVIKPQIDLVMDHGGSTWHEDQLLPIYRNGVLEDVYWTYGYSPIFNSDGTVGGTLVVCRETTNKIKERASLGLEKRQNEMALSKMESLFRQAPSALALLEGPQHRFVFANERYEKYFLHGPQYVGKTVSEVLPDAEAQGFVRLLDEVYKTGKRYVGDESTYTFNSPDGETFHFILNFVYEPVFDKDGRVEGILASISDITEQVVSRKKLESAVAMIEADRHRFSSIFSDASTSMALTKGPTHIFEYANPSYLSIFSGRDLLGKPVVEALPELKGQPFPELFERVYNTGVPYVEREAKAYLRRSADGPIEECYFDQTYTRISTSDGKPYGVFIHAFEVTERVFARRRLQESESQLRLATETARLGAWSFDVHTNMYSWTRRAAEIFGRPDLETIALSELKEYIHPDDRHVLDDDFRILRAQGGSAEIQSEVRISWPNQTIRWIQVCATTTWTDSAEGNKIPKIVGTVFDLTDRFEAQLELQRAKEAAENTNAAKSAFLANMSHEIRTPLGAIMGFVDLIKDEKLSQQNLDNYLAVIDRNSTQLLRIIDDILDLSKVEAGMMLIESVEFSLVEVLADFSSLMGFRARDRGILFTLKAKTELPDMIISDPTRLRQILTNVVGNAIKFTERGHVQLSASYLDGLVTFEVQDTGPGISKEQESGLFLPFSQADVSITRKFGGTGLGLVLTRRLTEAMGGAFQLVDSKLGEGSTFAATIKVKVPPYAKMVSALGYVPPATATQAIVGRLSGLKILLVEDSPDNQVLISIILRRTGALVDLAADGAEGVKAAFNADYDVILMDVQMPVLDGISAVKILREKGYTRPIIALTAHAMKEERDRCLKAGFNEFLSKPVQRDELFNLLTELHRSRSNVNPSSH